MRRLITSITILLMLIGCGASKRLPIESTKDSVSVVIKDSIIFKDSIILVEVPAESESAILPSTDKSHLETSLAESEAWVEDGRLNHTLRHKADVRLPKLVALPVYLHSEEKMSLSQRVVVKEVEKELTKSQKFLINLGKVVLIILFLYLIRLLVKIIKKVSVF